jgi:hypothetical protein
MRDLLKMMLCFLASISWAVAIKKWAPETVVWWIIGLVPSLLLVGVGGFYAIRSRIRMYRR